MDVGLLRLARTAGHGARADRWVRAYSSLGEHAGLWLALGLAGATLDRGRRRSWRRALCTVSLAYTVNQAIKLIVRRPRPELGDLPPLIPTPTRLSFPSAHATS
ncbi:MAG TPA: hypothetical protein VHE14_00080, partial [Solirubrobacteraceae bacterium]|nr:hypothetical protein [Solirubrobacteraceae bacterium]